MPAATACRASTISTSPSARKTPGVAIPGHLKARYPQEMTIVLQHKFWDLKVDRGAGSFSVGLSFGGVPSTLVVPFKALTAFADPQARFGLRFPAPEPAAAAAAPVPAEPAAEPPPTPGRRSSAWTPSAASGTDRAADVRHRGSRLASRPRWSNPAED